LIKVAVLEYWQVVVVDDLPGRHAMSPAAATTGSPAVAAAGVASGEVLYHTPITGVATMAARTTITRNREERERRAPRTVDAIGDSIEMTPCS
jgi:hypothetical protein